MGKRQKSIKRAWPDALDLMLICVESGISIEAGLRRVAGRNGKRVAGACRGDGAHHRGTVLSARTAAARSTTLPTARSLSSVKAVTQALIQAERYGTPIGQALRVLAQESRDERMNEAEKKAAALPPKLTVPMILFFLPVLIAVILGPAGIQVSDRF